MKICFVDSSGGHLACLYMLKSFWQNKKRFWATFDKEDARCLLTGEKIYPVYYPSNRGIMALIINSFRSIKELKKERPDLFVSSCVVPAIPFFDWEVNEGYEKQ